MPESDEKTGDAWVPSEETAEVVRPPAPGEQPAPAPPPPAAEPEDSPVDQMPVAPDPAAPKKRVWKRPYVVLEKVSLRDLVEEMGDTASVGKLLTSLEALEVYSRLKDVQEARNAQHALKLAGNQLEDEGTVAVAPDNYFTEDTVRPKFTKSVEVGDESEA